MYFSSQREDLKPLITISIRNLDELQRYGNENYQKYSIPNMNKSSFNKTLSNISGIYSNKNKYSN